MATEVTAPDGRTWIVRRRLAPRLGSDTLWGRFRGRFRRTLDRVEDVPDLGCLDAIGEGVTGVVVAIVLVLLAIFVLLPLLVAVVDVLIVLLAVAVGIVIRIVLRRPWVVEARADDGTAHCWRVVGWRASGARVLELSEHLQAGMLPPPDETIEAAGDG